MSDPTTPHAAPQVEIVLPVRNEERDLAPSVRQLAGYLREHFAPTARITIADNGSTDATWALARDLADAYPHLVRAVHLDLPGRGRALHAVWSASDAEVVAYMDVDLSTDLAALPPLVAPLLSGHSDVAIGSRLARGARVVRGTKREIISRGYNLLLRAVLGARFSDAQCGFKAVRAPAARALLPLVADTSWFFDTELLVLAQRAGLRIHEVPVDWTDSPDSRVHILDTALGDLRGVARLGWGLASRRLRVPRLDRGRLPGQPAPAAARPDPPGLPATTATTATTATAATAATAAITETPVSADTAGIAGMTGATETAATPGTAVKGCAR